MLKGIPKLLSPDLLKVLCEMGHADKIVISDGNFPAASVGRNAKRCLLMRMPHRGWTIMKSSNNRFSAV